MTNAYKTALAVLGAVAGYLWGPWDVFLELLVVFVALDYITGFVCAAVNRRLNSEVGFRGLARKMMIFVAIAVATWVERLVPSANSAIRSAACCFYIANEGLSILENISNMGVPFPESLGKLLSQMKSKHDDEEKK